MAEVRLTNLTKRYGEVVAVSEVNLKIADEEFVVLVGPSGCGKSTTLRMIAGLEEISGGTIEIGGRIVNELPPRDRDIAMVFQNYALYQHMTVYDNLAFGLRNRKMPEEEIRRRIDHAAGILSIGELMRRRPKQLSGGQQQRVALGRCLVRDPQLFLFDEPLSNLDAKLRAQMRLELKELRTRVPTTSVYVTHDQVEAMTLGDRIVVMKDGFVQQVGTPLELYRLPVNRFVAGFLGSPAMNFLQVSLAPKQGSLAVVGLGEEILLPEEVAESLARYAGQEVVLGVRPENILIEERAAPGTLHFRGSVVLTEQLGAQQLVELRSGSRTLMVAGIDPDLRLRTSEPLGLSVPLKHLHLFEAGENGRTLWSGSKETTKARVA